VDIFFVFVRGCEAPPTATLNHRDAVKEIWHQTKEHPCSLHKIRIILDKLPEEAVYGMSTYRGLGYRARRPIYLVLRLPLFLNNKGA
jgi:hypothetical protein